MPGSYTPKIQELMHNPEVGASLDKLREILPFKSETLGEELIEAARKQRKVESAQDITELYELLVNYTRHLPRSPSLETIRSREELLDDFIWYVTQPLRDTERDVEALESKIYDALTRHKAMTLRNVDFEHDTEWATEIIEDYFKVCLALPGHVRALQTRVTVLEKVFVDPEGLALMMGSRLLTLNEILLIQSSHAEGILKCMDDEINRTKWLKGLHSALDSTLDLFTYLERTYNTYKQVHVEIPEERITLPRPLEVRSIIHNRILYALKAGAENITVSLVSKRTYHAVISITDEFPGGIPEIARARLSKARHGDEIYEAKNEWDIIRTQLVPKLGRGARIHLESPLEDDDNKSRVSLVIPLFPPEEKPTPPGSGMDRGWKEKAVPVDTPETQTPTPGDESPKGMASVLPINEVAAIAVSGAPDVSTRITSSPQALRFFRKLTLDRFQASGMELFKVRCNAPNILTLTYSLKPTGK